MAEHAILGTVNLALNLEIIKLILQLLLVYFNATGVLTNAKVLSPTQYEIQKSSFDKPVLIVTQEWLVAEKTIFKATKAGL